MNDPIIASEEIITALTRSVANERLTDLVAQVADVGVSAISASLHQIPIVGVSVNLWRTCNDIRQALFVRKIVRFLEGLNSASPNKRSDFVATIEQDGKFAEFGETVLLILDRIDDTKKPVIVGRIIAACAEGHIEYERAMRLIAIVTRCYTADLEYLRNFADGTQEHHYDIADQLFSSGLLKSIGDDGGIADDPDSGGTMYALNDYGLMLVKYGIAEPMKP